ncbi:MAG: hypothetical protein DRO05_03035 [Thermoproteota archaeon]|nr:MAG: hypothetical protein DRO05_03035 [Candidatus Korarchaeota archaeon]
MFNELFGPSIYLLVLDFFLENPEEMFNVREIARRVKKNPGSISRVMPLLVERGLVKQVKIGKAVRAYRLNVESELVQVLIEFQRRLKGIQPS